MVEAKKQEHQRHPLSPIYWYLAKEEEVEVVQLQKYPLTQVCEEEAAALDDAPDKGILGPEEKTNNRI